MGRRRHRRDFSQRRRERDAGAKSQPKSFAKPERIAEPVTRNKPFTQPEPITGHKSVAKPEPIAKSDSSL